MKKKPLQKVIIAQGRFRVFNGILEVDNGVSGWHHLAEESIIRDISVLGDCEVSLIAERYKP